MTDGYVDRWYRCQQWTRALASVVYGPDSAGIPVFLDLDDEVLVKVAAEAGEFREEPRRGLVGAVMPTLNPPSHSAGIFGRQLSRLWQWRVEDNEPPPTLALLAVLCLAAEDMHGGDGLVAHDYYSRLMSLLGVDDDREKRMVENSYRACSSELWSSLNSWLEYNEGERGIPTAFALGFAHVGLPVSQAILRATDRERVREFFDDYGFAPRSHLAQKDMEALLGEWIGRSPSPASHALQGLWRRTQSRGRIVEAACALLESWDGSTSSSNPVGVVGARRSAQIQAIALRRTFPTRALELNFTGPSSDPDASTLDLIDSDGATQRSLAIEPFSERRWRLAEPGQMDPRTILDGQLRLRDSTGLTMERRPRRMVAMSHDDLLQVFYEVERVPLGEATLILCKEELASIVASALSIIARPGFTRDSELAGLPPGWALFFDVQVFAPLPSVQPNGLPWPCLDDLNALQPLATAKLVIEAGLRLPGHLRRWSSLSPPEIRIATEDVAPISLTVKQSRVIAGLVEPIELTTDESVLVVPLAGHSLPDGDYEVTASNAATRAIIDRARLRLRSAASTIRDRAPSLGRLPHDPVSVLNALILEPGAAPSIQGALVLVDRREGLEEVQLKSVVPEWWRARADVNSGAARADSVLLPLVALDDCFRTGRHIIVLPTYYGSSSASSVQGRCRLCGIVKRYPARYRPNSATTTIRDRYIPPAFDPSRVEAVATNPIAADVALDALCLDQSGGRHALEQLALQIEPSQLFVDRFLRGLESLGHIEVRRDARTLVASTWEVTPTVLAQTKPNAYVLTGFRNQRVLRLLERAAKDLGVEFSRRAQPYAPDRVRLSDCDVRTVMSIAKRVEMEADVRVSVVSGTAERLGRLLPPLSSIWEVLPRSPMIGYRSANRWDHQLARWTSVDDASVPGAFQLFGAVTTYCLRNTEDVRDGMMRRGDARIVKHLSSSLAGFPLLGYDAETENLYAPLGAELPGLYSRVATLASGLLPLDDTEQHLVSYRAVPSHIAAQLITLVSS